MRNAVVIKYKELIRSKWIYIYYIPVILISLFFIVLSKLFNSIYIGQWENLSTFQAMATSLLTIAISIFWVQRENPFEGSLPISNEISISSLFIAIFLFIFPLILLMDGILFVASLMVGNTIKYTWNMAAHLFIQQVTSYGLWIALGMVIGTIVKSKFAYVAVAPGMMLVSPYNEAFLQKYLGQSLLWQLITPLNHQPGNPFFPEFSYWYPNWEIYDRLFMVAFIIFLLLITFMLQAKRKKKFALNVIFTVGVFALLVYFAVGYGKSLPSEKYLYMNGEELSKEYNLNEGFNMKSIRMNMDINRLFTNEVEIDVINHGMEGIMLLALEYNLSRNIEEFFLNGEEAVYDIDGDIIQLHIPEKFQQKGDLTLNLKYSGRMEYVMNPGVEIYFNSQIGCNLPLNLPWYPLMDNEVIKEYNIKIQHKGTLLTNLNNFQLMEAGENYIKGEAKALYITCGEYEEKTIKSISFIGNRETLNKKIHIYEELAHWIKEKDHKEFNQVFVFPSIYSDNYYLSNTLMLSQNY